MKTIRHSTGERRGERARDQAAADAVRHPPAPRAVDLDAIRDGDWVTVRARARRQELYGVHLEGGFISNGMWYPNRDQFVGHEPAPRDVAPGDRVLVGGGSRPYEVLHVHGGRAWLDDAGAPLRNPCRPLSELRLVS